MSFSVSSLVVQWLRVSVVTVVAWVRRLLRELRSCIAQPRKKRLALKNKSIKCIIISIL